MVSDKLYARMQLSCSCGHVSRNMAEESRHRHNFPIFCKKKAVQCICGTNKKDTANPGRLLGCKRKTLNPLGLCWQHEKFKDGCATK